MKKLVKPLAVLLVLAICIACLAGCGSTETGTEPEELRDITLTEVTRSVFYAPQYAALSLGFFEEEGLNVELVTSSGADKVTAAVLSGESEIGFCGPEATVYVYNEGRENYLVTFAQLTKRDGSFLVAREPMEDFKWSDVAGSYIIGGRAGGMPEMTLEYVLRQNGLEPNVDVTVDTSIQFGATAGAFISGTGDYVALFEPAALALEREGHGYVVASVGQASGEVPYTCYNATKEFIEQNPDVIQGFTNAIYKGMEWVKENDAITIAETIHPYFSDMDINDLADVVTRYKDQDSWNDSPVFSEDAFELLLDIIIDAGVITEEDRVDYNILFDPTFAQNTIQ